MADPGFRLPAGVVSLDDYEALARARLDPGIWAYVSGGAGDERTLRWNREAFDRIALQGRALTDLAHAHTRLTLFGSPLDFPILLAPVALHGLAHHDGERETARAAEAMGAVMVVSTESSVAIEDIVAAATGARLWFQLYVQRDRGATRALVQRAIAAGCGTIVLTVDAVVNGPRNRQQRAGYRQPDDVAAVHLGPGSGPSFTGGLADSPLFGGALADAATWHDVEWLVAESPLPVLLKGITSPADAVRALELGVQGLAVSNHGGRTLDTLPAAIDILPRIADRVGGRVPLLLDGGIRRGTDIVKALALGASAVMIGRPYVYALAVAGGLGVAHALHILRVELEMAMALTGCATLGEISRAVLWEPPT